MLIIHGVYSHPRNAPGVDTVRVPGPSKQRVPHVSSVFNDSANAPKLDTKWVQDHAFQDIVYIRMSFQRAQDSPGYSSGPPATTTIHLGPDDGGKLRIV